MDWSSLFENIDLKGLIPECYSKWRPFVTEGLAWFLGKLSEERQKTILQDQVELGPFASAAERLESILKRCPTLHKLGQVLSRNNKLDFQLRKSLQKLETLKPSMTAEQVIDLIKSQNVNVEGLKFASTPLAQASVAVVLPFEFQDSYKNQKKGVFKVVRPEAEKNLEEELQLWPELGKVLENICHVNSLPMLEFAEPLADAALLVADEIRLDKEQSNIRKARELYKNIPEIKIPELYPWCTPRITSMSLVEGLPLSAAINEKSEQERKRIAERLLDGLIAKPFWMNETWAIFHGDPHSGNIFLDEKGQLFAIDWSLAIEMPKNDRVSVVKLFTAGMSMDKKAVTDALCQLGIAFDSKRIAATGEWAIEQIHKKNFPGFRWCLDVLDHAVEFGGLNLRAELALFRKALFSLLTLVEEIAPNAHADSIVVGAGLSELAAEWPSRAFANPFSQKWSTHVSTAEVLRTFSTMPLSITRFWFGCWSEILDKKADKTKAVKKKYNDKG